MNASINFVYAVTVTAMANANHQSQPSETTDVDRFGFNPIDQSNQDIPFEIRFPSGLDFERVVNQYSIQAIRDRFIYTNSFAAASKSNEEVQHLPQNMNGNDVNYDTFSTYLQPISSVHTSERKMPPFTMKQRHSITTTIRWVLTILTGLLTGVISIVIVTCTDIVRK